MQFVLLITIYRKETMIAEKKKRYFILCELITKSKDFFEALQQMKNKAPLRNYTYKPFNLFKISLKL